MLLDVNHVVIKIKYKWLYKFEDVKEKYNKICVVEDITDQWSIENSTYIKDIFIFLGVL